MIEIRRYTASDAKDLGVLIADTYLKVNLAQVPAQKRAAMLGRLAGIRCGIGTTC